MKFNREYKTRIKNGKTQVFVACMWRGVDEKECEMCGKMFLKPRTSQASDKGRFCSYDCNTKNRLKVLRRRRAYKRCVVCNASFNYPPAKADRIKTCRAPRCVLELRRRTSTKMWEERRKLG